jgi:hypothetical protein
MRGRSDGRVGGLRLDPEVQALVDGAAVNVAALTAKQRRDRKRIRIRLDVPAWLKAALAADAADAGTSANQLGAFLLAWVLREYRRDPCLQEAVRDAKRLSRNLRVSWDLEVPDKLEDFFTDGAN